MSEFEYIRFIFFGTTKSKALRKKFCLSIR
nr:MAG TPA: hypothetical protein [Corticoviridae sp.]